MRFPPVLLKAVFCAVALCAGSGCPPNDVLGTDDTAAYIVFMRFGCVEAVSVEYEIDLDRRGVNASGENKTMGESAEHHAACHRVLLPRFPPTSDVFINTYEYQLKSSDPPELAIPETHRQEQISHGEIIWIELPRYPFQGNHEETESDQPVDLRGSGYCYPVGKWRRLDRSSRRWKLFHDNCFFR